MLKRFLILAAVGATLGFTLALLFGPDIISWWFITPGTPTVLSCGEPITAALHYFVNLQLIIAGGAAFLAILIGMLLSRKKAAAPTTPAPPVS